MNKILVSMLCAAALLGGCGGGDDDHPPPVTEQVPGSVNTSSMSFIEYLKALVVSVADTLEPVDVGAVTPATDDVGEPTPVN